MWWQILSALGGLAVTVTIAIATIIYVKYTRKLWEETHETAALTEKNIGQTQKIIDLARHSAILSLLIHLDERYLDILRAKTVDNSTIERVRLYTGLSAIYTEVYLKKMFEDIDPSKHSEIQTHIENARKAFTSLGTKEGNLSLLPGWDILLKALKIQPSD